MGTSSDTSKQPSGQSALTETPDYEITFEAEPKRMHVVFNGETIADSTRTLVLFETRHADVHYFPRADVCMDFLRRTDHHTYCPYKGNAAYWSIEVGGETVENAAGREIEIAPRNQPVDVNLSPYYRAAVLGGMRAAVRPVTGTARRAANPDYDFGGKTGTAQVASAVAAGPEEDRPEELRNHAWFVGIAPADAPEIAIVVFVEHGGSGGVAAAPLAGLLMTAYFESRELAQR